MQHRKPTSKLKIKSTPLEGISEGGSYNGDADFHNKIINKNMNAQIAAKLFPNDKRTRLDAQRFAHRIYLECVKRKLDIDETHGIPTPNVDCPYLHPVQVYLIYTRLQASNPMESKPNLSIVSRSPWKLLIALTQLFEQSDADLNYIEQAKRITQDPQLQSRAAFWALIINCERLAEGLPTLEDEFNLSPVKIYCDYHSFKSKGQPSQFNSDDPIWGSFDNFLKFRLNQLKIFNSKIYDRIDLQDEHEHAHQAAIEKRQDQLEASPVLAGLALGAVALSNIALPLLMLTAIIEILQKSSMALLSLMSTINFTGKILPLAINGSHTTSMKPQQLESPRFFKRAANKLRHLSANEDKVHKIVI